MGDGGAWSSSVVAGSEAELHLLFTVLTAPLENDHHLIHCLLSSVAPAWGLEPPLPGSLLSELSREAAESKAFSSGRVLDGIGAMLESFILGINEKQALQVTVIANQSTVDGSNLYSHYVS